MANEKLSATLSKLIKDIREYLPASARYDGLISNIDTLHLLNVYFKSQLLVKESCLFQKMDFEIPLDTNGFMMVMNKEGDLLYVSANVDTYMQLTPDELMLANDGIFTVISSEDEENMRNVLRNESEKVKPFFITWRAQKRRCILRTEDQIVKIEGHFIDDKIFVAICTPTLTPANRDTLADECSNFFTTAHSKDLSFLEICKNGEAYFGKIFENKRLNDVVNFEHFESLYAQVISTESNQGYLITASIQHIDGNFMHCLVNIYPSGDYIICNYQIYSASELQDLNQYYATSEKKHLSEYARLYNPCTNYKVIESTLNSIESIDIDFEALFESPMFDSLLSDSNNTNCLNSPLYSKTDF